MELPPLDDLDDSTNLESKVLLALSKLQTEKRRPNKRNKANEVTCQKIVEFLKANYPCLDGDIESQVITALLSCVKTGVVCALKNGKYRLIGPNSKKMVINCLARTSHGPKCCCLAMLKCMFKAPPYTCCCLKNDETSSKKSKKIIRTKPKPLVKEGLKQKTKKSTLKNKCQIKCALLAQNLFGTSRSAISMKNDDLQLKCDLHSPSKSRRICKNCQTPESITSVPYDKFSPRDETVLNSSFLSSSRRTLKYLFRVNEKEFGTRTRKIYVNQPKKNHSDNEY